MALSGKSLTKLSRLAVLTVALLFLLGLFSSARGQEMTPPTSPSAADIGTGGKISLMWTNPSSETFASVTIYRSTRAGNLGAAMARGLIGTEKIDSTVTNGTKYFYTIRAVSTAGAESSNTNQVSAMPTRGKLPKTGAIWPTRSWGTLRAWVQQLGGV